MILTSVVKILNFITQWIHVPFIDISSINTFFAPLGLVWNFVDKELLYGYILFIISLEIGVIIWKLIKR